MLNRHPRIVICTASVGCGHTRAATAIRHAIRRARPDASVRIIEVLDYAPRWFVTGYRDAYLAAIARVPALAGRMYDATDRPARRPGLSGAIESRALDRLLHSPCLAKADVIVATHFLAARVLAFAKQRGVGPAFLAPLAVCVTDRHPHGVWLVPGADLMLVASPDAANIASAATGAPSLSCGIPIDGDFGAANTCRRDLRIPERRPVLLACGGGLGLGGIDLAVNAALTHRGEFHVVAVCGRNEDLRRRLEPLTREPRPGMPSCQVMGFTTRMPELMAIAGVMVGKPGGLTTAEALASGLPAVLLKPIPGQEERNASQLVEAGAAMLVPDPARAGDAAVDLLLDSARVARMRQAARAMGNPRAADDAAAAILDLAEAKRDAAIREVKPVAGAMMTLST